MTTRKVAVYAGIFAMVFMVVTVLLTPMFVPIADAIIALLWPEAEVPPEETEYFYQVGGQLQIDFPIYWSYDKAVQTTNLPQIYIYHADKVNLFASDTSGTSTLTVTGELKIADEGILYGVIDWATGTTYYLDAPECISGYVKEFFAWDHDDDGTLEWGFKIDVTKLSKLAAGETKKTISANLYVIKYESSITATSVTNATGCNTAGDYYAEGYFKFNTGEGYGWKITKVELTMPDTANATMVDDGDVELKSVVIWDWSWTSYDFSLADKRFLMDIGVVDFNEEYYGKQIYYARGAGVTFCKYKIHIYAGASFTASERFTPTLKVTYINPAGTISTKSRVVNFEG